MAVRKAGKRKGKRRQARKTRTPAKKKNSARGTPPAKVEMLNPAGSP